MLDVVKLKIKRKKQKLKARRLTLLKIILEKQRR